MLGNGARVYDDHGRLEYATPVCTNPAELAAHVLAGDGIIQQGIIEASGQLGIKRQTLKNCVGYGNDPVTAGCHENYGYRCPRELLTTGLIPFLASRVIFTGVGGFDPHMPLRFSLSPRVAFLKKSNGNSNTYAIINGRNESHAKQGYKRLHIICGEPSCSHLSIYLKLGTTALIVAMIDGGREFASTPTPSHPLDAMRRFAADPTCKSRVIVESGNYPASAIEIQRAYLEAVESCRGESWMPEWGESVLCRWRSTLDLLENDAAESVALSLDWAIKWGIYKHFISEQGFELEEIKRWDHEYSRCKNLTTTEDIARELLSPRRQRYEISKKREEQILQLRYKLFELDNRYADLGPDGLFNSLDQQMLLDHRIPEIQERTINRAKAHAPSDTRARVRGRVINRLHNQGKSTFARADWNMFFRPDAGKLLDLSDPFVVHPTWVNVSKNTNGLGPESSSRYLRELEFEVQLNRVQTMYDSVNSKYRSGRFLEAFKMASQYSECDVDILQSNHFNSRHSYAISNIRQDIRDLELFSCTRLGSKRCLDMVDGHNSGDTSWSSIHHHLFVYSHYGLIPHAKIEPWIERAYHDDRSEGVRDEGYADSAGRWHLSRGELDEARKCLEPHAVGPMPMRGVRIRTELINTYRRLGLIDAAHEILFSLSQCCRMRYPAYVAEYLLPAKAKLTTNHEEQIHMLQKALRIQQRLNNKCGVTRTAILLARAFAMSSAADQMYETIQLYELVRQGSLVEAYEQCPRFKFIAENWDAWLNSQEPDATGDYWWGL
jgi:Pup-ligase protein